MPKDFLGAAKIARFSLYCATELLGTAKVARFTVPKFFLRAAKIARFSLYCATKFLGTAKVARFIAPKIFLGAAKIARFSLYCVKKLLGIAKLARCTVPKVFLGAAKIARFNLYCATKLLGTAKVARFTVPKNFLGDWKVNVSKPAPIHGEHQSPAQWPHTRILPGKKTVNIRKHDRPHGANLRLTSPHPSFLSSKIKTDHKIRRMGFTTFGLRALGRLTADVHHKLCSKQHAPSVEGCNQTAEKSS